jgi:predicted dehydrogenase
MTIRLAFCGTGYIGQIHADAAKKLDDVEIVAVVNPFEDRREKFAKAFKVSRQYSTVEELVRAGDVDAITINTPNYLHNATTR